MAASVAQQLEVFIHERPLRVDTFNWKPVREKATGNVMTGVEVVQLSAKFDSKIGPVSARATIMHHDAMDVVMRIQGRTYRVIRRDRFDREFEIIWR